MTKRILIVDDERHIGTLLAHTLDDLEDSGVELIVTDRGQEAVDLAVQSPPDLAFVDLDMPGTSGWAVCEALRERLTDQQLAIVLLVNLGQEPDPDRCAALSIVEFVSKPFDPDRVRALACAALGFDFEG